MPICFAADKLLFDAMQHTQLSIIIGLKRVVIKRHGDTGNTSTDHVNGYFSEKQGFPQNGDDVKTRQ